MNKKFLRRISVLFLFAVLFTAISPLVCFATADDEPSREFVRWKLSEDERTLSDGKTTYTRYHLPLGVILDARSEYRYENTVFLDGEYTSLISNQPGGQVVWSNYGNFVFVTDSAREDLDAFVENDKGIMRLWVNEDAREATIAEETVSALNALAESGGRTVSVQELEDALVYILYLCDESNIFCKEYGGIYKLSGKLYYLNYRTLSNNHFDSEGYFSYRSGSVTVYPLDNTLTNAVRDADEKAEYRGYETIWENEEGWLEVVGDSFPIAYAFWGFVLPIAFTSLGAILPTVKKRTKCWGILTLLGVLWLILATVLMILML